MPLSVDIPQSPGNLQLSPETSSTVVVLSWTASPVPVASETILKPVDLYVIERSFNGQSYEQVSDSSQVFTA